MKRLAKIATMMVVYLLWICGSTVIDLSCHAKRLHNHDKYHTTHHEVCDCHHQNWQTPHFESPHSCNHNHSVEVELYDIAKKISFEVEPLALYTSQIDDTIAIEELFAVHSSQKHPRKTPIPLPPTIFGYGLRAPPVVA